MYHADHLGVFPNYLRKGVTTFDNFNILDPSTYFIMFTKSIVSNLNVILPPLCSSVAFTFCVSPKHNHVKLFICNIYTLLYIISYYFIIS